MSRTTSISIGSQLDECVNTLIPSGRYGSTSEVVCSALRLLEKEEKQEKQSTALRMAIEAGERSVACPLSLDDIADKVNTMYRLN